MSLFPRLTGIPGQRFPAGPGNLAGPSSVKAILPQMAESDLDIVELVRSGDRKAFSHLVDRHKDRAMALAVRMLRNRQDAEEALQDAFVRSFNALPRFEGRSSFGT